MHSFLAAEKTSIVLHLCSLFDPGRRPRVRRLHADVELLDGGLQCLRVAGEVGGHGVVEKQQLLLHYLHLGEKRQN